MHRTRQGITAGLAAAALAMAAPGAAHAGEIYQAEISSGVVAWVFEAREGVHDVVNVYQDADEVTFGFIDGPGDPVTFPAECRRDATEGINCPTAGTDAVALATHDGNDTVVGNTGDLVDLPMLILGGDGDDVLAGGASADVLAGEEGADTLRDTPQRDVLDAGPGDDRLMSIGPNFRGDLFDGGEGRDHLTVGRATAHAWSLDGAANDGEDGEGDNATGIEHLTNEGEGEVVLIGDDGPNRLDAGLYARGSVVRGLGGDDELSGGLTADVLEGGDGADRLVGERGDDLLDGGAGVDVFLGDRQDGWLGDMSGNDTIRARDGAQERVDCGFGVDTAELDGADLATDCEGISRPAEGGPPPPPTPQSGPVVPAQRPRLSLPSKLRDKKAPYVLTLRGKVTDVRGCAGEKVTITVRKGVRTVARRTTKLSRACTFRAPVRLRSRGRYTAIVRGAGLIARTTLRAG